MLTHELAPVTPSLFNDDGTMRKTSKADLAKKLESNCDEIQVLGDSDEHDTACIIDGMALLQALDDSRFDTFDDLGLVVMQRIQSLLDGNLGVTSVTVVFDRYDSEVSIKQLERDRRADGEKTHTYKLQKILEKRLQQIRTGRVHLCIPDTNRSTDPQGAAVNHTGRRFRRRPSCQNQNCSAHKRRPTHGSCSMPSISPEPTRESLSDAMIPTY